MNERPCITGCGEVTANEHGRCRDCELDHLFETWIWCAHCGQPQYSEVIRFGDWQTEDINHTPACPDRLLLFQFTEARDRWLMTHAHDPLVRLAARNRDQARLYEQAMGSKTTPGSTGGGVG